MVKAGKQPSEVGQSVRERQPVLPHRLRPFRSAWWRYPRNRRLWVAPLVLLPASGVAPSMVLPASWVAPSVLLVVVAFDGSELFEQAERLTNAQRQ